MKITKSQRSNIIFLIVLALLFFSPLGGLVKEYSARLLAFAPSVENKSSRATLNNYNWKLKGLNTTDFNFENAREKVVVLNFWATWCPPCRAEMPSLQNLYNDYKEDVVFLFLTNEESEKVIRFLEKNKYNLPSFNQYTQTPAAFPVSSIPATYIIDRNGSIVIDKVGPADWNSKTVRVLLDELLQK
jgi:thiol-disulfide isomerase/thioredoxin